MRLGRGRTWQRQDDEPRSWILTVAQPLLFLGLFVLALYLVHVINGNGSFWVFGALFVITWFVAVLITRLIDSKRRNRERCVRHRPTGPGE